MARKMALLSRLVAWFALVAVLVSGLHVPVHYHGHSEESESHVHLIVHRHHGRLHIHVHHHEPDCHSDRELRAGNCGDDHCEADHAPEIWLATVKCDGWRNILLTGLAAQTQHAWDAASIMAQGSAFAIGRSPPLDVTSSQISAIRSVILRL